MSGVTIIGIHLETRVFQIHRVHNDGSVALRKKLSWGQVLAFFAQQPRCVVAMEACATADGWGTRTREAWPFCAPDPANLREAMSQATEE